MWDIRIELLIALVSVPLPATLGPADLAARGFAISELISALTHPPAGLEEDVVIDHQTGSV
jgi:hypothetical protein